MQDYFAYENIKSKAKDRIEQCNLAINEFIVKLNSLLDDDEKVELKKFFTVRSDEDCYFEDDGHTRADGYTYYTYWCFQLNSAVAIDEWHVKQGYQKEVLYFKLQNEERKRDLRSDKHMFFSLYLVGIEYPRKDKEATRIDYNNDNYDLLSIINDANIVSCALKIKEIAKRRRMMAQLEKFDKKQTGEEMTMWVKCKDCKGKGIIQPKGMGIPFECSTCKGRKGFDVPNNKKICPVCNGRGTVYINFDPGPKIECACETCSKTGFVDKE